MKEYNNRVLTPEEREEYCRIADGHISKFSGHIEEIFQLSRDASIVSGNSEIVEINKRILDILTFATYAFCDCIVLDKLFIMATHPYEKSLLRGKLKVQLNESFKKLYGFKKGYNDSYCAKLEDIVIRFLPEFKKPFDELLSDLEQLSKDSWWKDERDAEVHIDAAQLYELRHKEINESRVAMETGQLTDLFTRIYRFIANLYILYIKRMLHNIGEGMRNSHS